MNRVTRGEKVLERLANEGAISHCGADWLVAAIDPFHDKQLAHLQGWPDLESGSSVVRCIKQSITVAVPPTVVAGSNWDCHVIMWPWLSGLGNPYSVSTGRAGQSFTYAAPFIVASPIGGLQVYGMPAGDPLSLMQTGNVRQIGRIDVDNQFTQGSGRLCGMGFEVHNTTSQLNIQGAVAVYRQMANSRSPNTFVGTSGGTQYPFSGVPVRAPPATLANALLLQGSRQWEAKDGCYVVAAFNDAENPAFPIQPMSPVIIGGGLDDLETVVSTNAINFLNPGVILAGTTIASAPAIRVHPVHQSGAIFTGLSYSTTLTLNYNVFYESFPGLAQVEILPLASPSCEFDPDALDLFERILQDLPVGVKVRENGLGDWFLGAITDAAKFLGPAISSIPHPIAQGAGALIKYAGDTMAGYRDKVPPNSWESEGGVADVPPLTKRKVIKKKKNPPATKPKAVKTVRPPGK